MLDKLKKTGRNTIIYGVGNVLNKSLGIILIPFIQKYVPIGDYGRLTILELLVLALSSTVILGITHGHERFFYKEKENGSYGSFLFSNSISLLSISSFLILIFALFSNSLSLVFFNSDHFQYLILLSLIIAFLELNNAIPFQILQYEERAIQYIIANSLRLLISLLSSIYFVAYMNLGIEGVLYGRLLGSGLFTITQFITVVLPRMKFKYSFEKVKISVKYGIPMIIANIGYIIFSMSDRFMLSKFSTPELTGKYGFGYKMANIILLIVQSIGVGYLPSFFQNEKNDNNSRYYRKMLTYFFFVMSFMILGFLFSYKVMLRPFITNQDYWSGLQVVPILALAFMCMGMGPFINIGIVLNNKTKYFLLPTLVGIITNITLIYFFIPLFGLMGPAIATLISQILYISMITITSERLKKVDFEWRKIFLSLFIAILFFVIGEMINFNSNIILIIVRLALLAAYPVILYKLNFFEAVEIEKLLKVKARIIDYGKKIIHK